MASYSNSHRGLEASADLCTHTSTILSHWSTTWQMVLAGNWSCLFGCECLYIVSVIDLPLSGNIHINTHYFLSVPCTQRIVSYLQTHLSYLYLISSLLLSFINGPSSHQKIKKRSSPFVFW